MAVDEALLESLIEGSGEPTLRLYGWRPPCVSVGYFQSLRAEIRPERCREAGVEWVRRITGGRLILHDMELTYSIVARESDPLVSGGILESYRKISAGLRAGLAALGVAAELADPADPRVAGAGKIKGGLCFDTPASYEMVVDGRKLAGSAQTRRRGAILQHGSILIDVDVPTMFAVLNGPQERTLAEFREAFAKDVVSLREVLGRTPSREEVGRAIADGFARAWEVDLRPGELSAHERELAAQLREKYAGEEWNERW